MFFVPFSLGLAIGIIVVSSLAYPRFEKMMKKFDVMNGSIQNFEPSLNSESLPSLQEAAQNTQRYGLFTEDVSRFCTSSTFQNVSDKVFSTSSSYGKNPFSLILRKSKSIADSGDEI